MKSIKKVKGTEVTPEVTITPKRKFNSLDELFNFSRKKQNLIKADTFEQYKLEIEKMNLADLQTHAISLSLKPSKDRAMLEKALLNNFAKHKASLVAVVSTEPNSSVKNLDRVLKILSKGA